MKKYTMNYFQCIKRFVLKYTIGTRAEMLLTLIKFKGMDFNFKSLHITETLYKHIHILQTR